MCSIIVDTDAKSIARKVTGVSLDPAAEEQVCGWFQLIYGLYNHVYGLYLLSCDASFFLPMQTMGEALKSARGQVMKAISGFSGLI